MRDDVTYHETATFDRWPAAAAWMKQRERELTKSGVIDRTKAQVLKAIKKFPSPT